VCVCVCGCVFIIDIADPSVRCLELRIDFSFGYVRQEVHTEDDSNQIIRFLLLRDAMASAILAMALCLSVRPSQVRVQLKRLNELSWFLACELPSTHPTLC